LVRLSSWSSFFMSVPVIRGRLARLMLEMYSNAIRQIAKNGNELGK